MVNLATIDMFINELCSRYANMVRQLLIETINPINSNKEGIYINDDDNGGGAGGEETRNNINGKICKIIYIVSMERS